MKVNFTKVGLKWSILKILYLLHTARKFLDKFKSDHMEFHGQEIQKLSSVMTLIHLKENELAMRFRQNKYNLKMCEYSFTLIMSFLQDNSFVLLLRIINAYVNILAFAGKPKSSLDEKGEPLGVVTGSSLQIISGINNKSIFWGRLPEDQDFLDAIEAKKQEMEKNGELQTHERDKEILAERKSMLEAEENMPPRDRVPLPKFKEEDVSMEILSLQELRNQIKLSRSELPSIACYTFHNTHDALTSVRFSYDSTMVSAGFDDSIIKVWSLKGQNLYALKNGTDIHSSEISSGM